MPASMKIKKPLAIFCGFLAALFLFALIIQLINYQKVIQGVTAAGQDFSGLTIQESQVKLDALIANIETQKIEIKYNNNIWRVLPAELGIDFDARQTIKNIYGAGRNQNFFSNIKDQASSLFRQKNISLSYEQDEQKFNYFIEKSLSALENPPKNATLKFDRNLNDFILIPSRDGQIFDLADFKRQINGAARCQVPSKKVPDTLCLTQIILKRIPAKAVLTKDQNSAARTQAKKILELAPYSLKYNSEKWPIEKEILLEWFEFVPVSQKVSGTLEKVPDTFQTMAVLLSEEGIKEFLLGLAPAINKEPIDGKLTAKDDKVIEFSLSQNGTELKIDESAKKINRDILENKKEIQLIITEKPPLISTKTIDTLGLTNLLGQGTSNFAGSPKNRIHNISIGASKISGALVGPGEEFSFVKSIGEIEAKQGYLPELVIKNKKTVPEYGGGICQVSTTLFRAAINAGLKITARYPHAFPVKYYNPQGFDATIYPPNPDLKFLNDTPNNILIQSKIDGTKITFEIYGTKDDREIKIIGPTILESNPDGSMKTVLYQEIWRDGVLERKDTFRSNYKSPALYPTVKNPLE